MPGSIPASVSAEPAPASAWRRVRARTGLLILAIIVAMAILAPLLTPYDPYKQDLLHRRMPPVWHAWLWDDDTASAAHPLGTDKVGRDTWTRLLFGTRISLIVGFVTALVSGAIGTAIGTAAGYWGGRID